MQQNEIKSIASYEGDVADIKDLGYQVSKNGGTPVGVSEWTFNSGEQKWTAYFFPVSGEPPFELGLLGDGSITARYSGSGSNDFVLTF